MYYGKVDGRASCFFCCSPLFRKVFDNVMAYARDQVHTCYDAVNCYILDHNDDWICSIRVYYDGYTITYRGFNPMCFRTGSKDHLSSVYGTMCEEE